jgi:hypothetical protein
LVPSTVVLRVYSCSGEARTFLLDENNINYNKLLGAIQGRIDWRQQSEKTSSLVTTFFITETEIQTEKQPD